MGDPIVKELLLANRLKTTSTTFEPGKNIVNMNSLLAEFWRLNYMGKPALYACGGANNNTFIGDKTTAVCNDWYETKALAEEHVKGKWWITNWNSRAKKHVALLKERGYNTATRQGDDVIVLLIPK